MSNEPGEMILAVSGKISDFNEPGEIILTVSGKFSGVILKKGEMILIVS